MKRTFLLCNILLACLAMSGCQRSATDVWEDGRTAGRYMGRSVKSLAGKHGDSRQFSNRDEFGLCYDDNGCFTPMDGMEICDNSVPQSRLSPGEPGSGVPTIDSFRDPMSDPELNGVFRTIYFDYNSPLVRGDRNLDSLRAIADYLKRHPNTYIFIEGHCDERGPQSYNFALGSNRSNTVRNYLAQEGVNPDNMFTISYGKDHPVIAGHDEQSWSQNRRAQFKVYSR